MVTAALQPPEIAEKILFWGQVRWKERLLFRLWRIGPAERPVLGACSRTSDESTNTYCDHLPGEDASALLGTADVNNAALVGQSSPKAARGQAAEVPTLCSGQEWPWLCPSQDRSGCLL